MTLKKSYQPNYQTQTAGRFRVTTVENSFMDTDTVYSQTTYNLSSASLNEISSTNFLFVCLEQIF